MAIVLPPATGRLPARELLPKPEAGNTDWRTIEDRSAAATVPDIPGEDGGCFYTMNARCPDGYPQILIYEADLTDVDYELGELVQIESGFFFTILDHGLVEVVYDPSRYK